MKKWIKITLIAAAVLAVLIVIAAIAVSPVAKNYIEKHDRELIGRSIRMERLRMNIFTGRLRVEGLKIGAAGDSTTFFALDSFDMRMRILPLLSNRVVVKHITFAGLNVKVYQRGSAFSFDDIIDHFASDTTPSPPSRGRSASTTSPCATAACSTKIWSSMRYGVSTTSTCRFRAFISGVKRPTWAPC